MKFFRFFKKMGTFLLNLIVNNWVFIIVLIGVLIAMKIISLSFPEIKPKGFIGLSIGPTIAIIPVIYEFIKEHQSVTGKKKRITLAMLIVIIGGFIYTVKSTAQTEKENIDTKEANRLLQENLSEMKSNVDTVTISQEDAKNLLTTLKDASNKIQSTADLIKERTDRSIYINDSVTRSQMRIRRSMDEQRMYSAYQLLIWSYDENLRLLKNPKNAQVATTEFYNILQKIKAVLVGELNNEIMTTNPYIKPIWLWMNHELTGFLGNPGTANTAEEFAKLIQPFFDKYCYFKKQIFSYYALNNERFEYNKEAEKRVKAPKWGISISIITPHGFTSVPNCDL